jgi:hypothetical protein
MYVINQPFIKGRRKEGQSFKYIGFKARMLKKAYYERSVKRILVIERMCRNIPCIFVAMTVRVPVIVSMMGMIKHHNANKIEGKACRTNGQQLSNTMHLTARE